jgi:hypothetical protein
MFCGYEFLGPMTAEILAPVQMLRANKVPIYHL